MESRRRGASQVSCSYAAVETANLRLFHDSDRARCSAARLRPALDLWSRHICMSPMPFETISGRTLLACLLGVACGNRSRAIDTNERRQGCLAHHDVAVLLARMSTRRAVCTMAGGNSYEYTQTSDLGGHRDRSPHTYKMPSQAPVASTWQRTDAAN